MDEKNKKETKKQGSRKEDADLWEAVTQDVKRLPARNRKSQTFSGATSEAVQETVYAPSAETRRKGKTGGNAVDGKTGARLRGGKMEIQGRLDLHGLRREEAEEALRTFLIKAHAAGKRCVLVITGKGSKKAGEEGWWDVKPGVLRAAVPDWLKKAPLDHIVLQTQSAQRKDGGAGALYVLLRRQR